MKLDRNENTGRIGKYALINLRKLYSPGVPLEAVGAIQLLADQGILEWGEVGTESEFFVMKLKDRHSQSALTEYGRSASNFDEEYAREICEMAQRAGESNPWCKDPD
jgi:hypothetical protein